MLDGETFWNLLEQRTAASPDAVMLIDERDRRLTFAQYRRAAERIAAGFHALGVGRGSVVSYQLPTRIETIVLMAGLARLGAVQNPIVPIYRETEVAFCLRQTGASLLCVPAEASPVDYDDVRVIVTESDLPSGDPAELPPPPPPSDGREVRWIYYSSGTTADPKGVRHTDQTVAAASAGLVRRQRYRPDERFGVAFPFTHVGGLTNLIGALQNGHTLVTMESFAPGAAAELFARHGVTIIGGGPVFAIAFLDEQRKRPDRPILPDLRFLSGGGAPMASELHYEFKREVAAQGCAHGYGMTECPIICTNDPEDDDERLASTEGRPIDGMDVRVVTLSGEAAAIGQEGEVRLKGPAVCKGYLDPTAHAEAFDAEGWFRTGDVGYVDADGYVTLTGRVKDIIIRKGENISANEIEGILYAHPKVAEAAVIGVPDRERGELVCAIVTAADPAAPLGFGEMVRHFHDARVMRQKIPERLETIDAMPRNPTGKIRKQDLRELFKAS